MSARLASKGKTQSFLLSYTILGYNTWVYRAVCHPFHSAVAHCVSAAELFSRTEGMKFRSPIAGCERSNMVTSGDTLKAIHADGIIFFAVR